METRLLTTAEIARRAGFHENTVRKWIKTGRFPAIKFGNKWRVDVGDWNQFVESLTTLSNDENAGADRG